MSINPMPASSSAPIRLLLWSPSGSGKHYHGPGSFTYRLFQNATEDELKITLVHGFPNQKSYELFEKQVYLCNYKSSTFEQIRFINDGKKWIGQNYKNFDVMHSISGYQNSIEPSFHAEKLGLPAAVFIANHHKQLGASGGWRRLIGLHKKRQKMARDLTAFIALSTAIREELLSYNIPEERIFDIPMGVNTSVFNPADSKSEKTQLRKKMGIEDMPTVLFVGTLVDRKRPDLIIKAIAALKAQKVDCQLILCGPETDQKYVREMKDEVERAGIQDRIIWAGFHSDVSPYYKISDYFCLPSSNEGMAASLVEAMASGLVPIVTPVSGSTDLVSEGFNGKHVQESSEEIASALNSYIDDSQLSEKHSACSLELVRKKYNDKVVYAKYLELYRHIRKQ